jgi:hypothetical protein
VFDAIDELPRVFDFVATREERGVAAHGIEQQTFVGLGEALPKLVP